MLNVQPNEDVIGWHIIRPQDSGAKCASAQWNYTYCGGNGCDWAAVLYQCAVVSFKIRLL